MLSRTVQRVLPRRQVLSGVRARTNFNTISASLSRRSFVTEATVARFDRFGQPKDVITIEKEKLKKVEKKDVLVKYLVAPINPSDLNMIEGTYPITPKLPGAVGGNEGLAQIVEVGPDVTGLKVGDYVIPAKAALGTWRTHAVVNESDLHKLPEGPSDKLLPEHLATLSVNPSTALRLLEDFVPLQKGDVIIQNGANSMVGLSVIQIAHARGIKTINIIREGPHYAETVERIKQYGGYIACSEEYLQTAEFRRLISDLPKPKLALNCVSGPSATEMARILGDNATLVTYGAMSRKPITVPSSLFIFKNLSFKGFWLSKWLNEHSVEERENMYKQLIDLIKDNKLRLWSERHNFSNFNEALSRTYERGKARKVVLVLDK